MSGQGTSDMLLVRSIQLRWQVLIINDGRFLDCLRFRSFYLIEGIGTSRTPLSVLFPNSFENANQLRCFSSQGVHPRCTPATPLFKTYSMYPFFAPQPIPVDSFDNDSSCVIRYYSADQVSGVQTSTKSLIVPNPGGREAILTIPSITVIYNLTIRDVVGRIVAA
jgi:hypothetical protein